MSGCGGCAHCGPHQGTAITLSMQKKRSFDGAALLSLILPTSGWLLSQDGHQHIEQFIHPFHLSQEPCGTFPQGYREAR